MQDQIVTPPLSEFEPDPQNPRSKMDPGKQMGLSEDLKRGQIYPVIGYRKGAKVRLVDGHRRLAAAELAGLPTLKAIVLDHEPTPREVAMIQARIDWHREDLNPMERSNLLARMQGDGGTLAELGALVGGVSQSMVTKLLSFQRGAPEVQDKIAARELDIDRAYMICQEPDHDKQRALLQFKREELRRQRVKAKGNGQAVEVKASVARFPLQAGLMVIVQGKEVTLEGAVNAMQDAVKELKKGLAQGIGIDAMQRVMKDRSKAGV